MIGNLLSLAMGVVGGQPLQLSKFLGRTTNAAGYHESTYAAPVAIQGHAQPVPRKLYQALGLNFERAYITIYTPANVVTVARDGSGDKVTYDGATWICEEATTWAAQAGWVVVTAIKAP